MQGIQPILRKIAARKTFQFLSTPPPKRNKKPPSTQQAAAKSTTKSSLSVAPSWVLSRYSLHFSPSSQVKWVILIYSSAKIESHPGNLLSKRVPGYKWSYLAPVVAALWSLKSSLKYATSLQDYKIQASLLPPTLAIWQWKFYLKHRVSSTDTHTHKKKDKKNKYQIRKMEVGKNIIAGSGN